MSLAGAHNNIYDDEKTAMWVAFDFDFVVGCCSIFESNQIWVGVR